MKSPCMSCRDRQVGCHSSCASYLLFREEVDAVNASRVEEARLIRTMADAKKGKRSDHGYNYFHAKKGRRWNP